MPAYSFKKNCKVYLVTGNTRFKIEVYPDLNFSQTFNETAIKVKTLHDQNAMFEDATITTANPADFNFTVLMVKGNDFNIIGDWLTTIVGTGSDEALTTYDIYVDNSVDVFKLEKGVATRGTFLIQRDALVTVSIEGQASRLTRFGASGVTIPGVLQARDAALTPIIVRALDVLLNSVTQAHIAGISLEISNEIEWIQYDTLHKSLYVTSASDTQYPEAFVVVKKVLSGTIQQYVTDINNGNLQTWSTNSTLRIRVGDGAAYYLDADLPKVVYTNQVQVEDLFVQSYNFRLTSSPADIATVLKYNL
jgi:hypothetical protein